MTKYKMGIDTQGGISKTLGVAIAVLTIVSIICGAVFWIVHQNDMLQMQVGLLQQQVRANSEGIKTLNSKREQEGDNFDKMMQLIGALYNRR